MRDLSSALQAVLADAHLADGRRRDTDDPAALKSRIRELELLCAEVYVAAVEIGLPQPLLSRLHAVAAPGSLTHALALPIPTPTPAAPTPAAPPPPPTASSVDQLLTQRDGRTRPTDADLAPLRERRRVMVVDDDAMRMEVLVRILGRENYELITAGSGPDALQKAAAAEGPIDLLITDYAMPEMEGLELAEKMRQQYPNLRVLYQTGFGDLPLENRLPLVDGGAILEKPFTARRLRETARSLLFGTIDAS